MTLAERLSASLAKRLYPCTPLSPKQVAFAIDVAVSTLWRWKTEPECSMPAQKLVELDNFFASRGYPGLLSETLVSRGIPKEVMPHSGAEAPLYNATPRDGLMVPGACRALVERLPLDRLSIPAGRDLASLAASGGDLVTAAENAGGSIFRVYGGEVVALHLGPSTGMRETTKRAFLGIPVDRWSDPAYGRLVKGHVLEAHSGQATYYQMDVPVLELRIPYRRAMFPAGDGFVVGISERLAA